MQKKQFGRSMIEMLGVLAIIGVLSIGGLLGYRRAVNNHQANVILDDANRLAFVVMENDRAFEPNTVITDDFDFVPTGIYHMDAFLGTAAGQFGIVVTDVPKGVCEALLPKASAEYKVRVASAKTADNVQQLAAYGVLYDEQDTDICNNTNDIALYFGDVSKQYNPTDADECTSYTDCPHGSFCWFPNSTCHESGLGQCKKVSAYNPETKTMEDGNTWTRSVAQNTSWMNWWSAQSWCEALGLQMARRSDLGCKDAGGGEQCATSKMEKIQKQWGANDWYYLLEDKGNNCNAWTVRIADANVSYDGRHFMYFNVLCH